MAGKPSSGGKGKMPPANMGRFMWGKGDVKITPPKGGGGKSKGKGK